MLVHTGFWRYGAKIKKNKNKNKETTSPNASARLSPRVVHGLYSFLDTSEKLVPLGGIRSKSQGGVDDRRKLNRGEKWARARRKPTQSHRHHPVASRKPDESISNTHTHTHTVSPLVAGFARGFTLLCAVCLLSWPPHPFPLEGRIPWKENPLCNFYLLCSPARFSFPSSQEDIRLLLIPGSG